MKKITFKYDRTQLKYSAAGYGLVYRSAGELFDPVKFSGTWYEIAKDTNEGYEFEFCTKHQMTYTYTNDKTYAFS